MPSLDGRTSPITTTGTPVSSMAVRTESALSGALLIAVAPDSADSVLTAIEDTGVPVVVIGEVRPSKEGITIVTNGAVEPLTPPVRDEIARAFEGGYEGL